MMSNIETAQVSRAAEAGRQFLPVVSLVAGALRYSHGRTARPLGRPAMRVPEGCSPVAPTDDEREPRR